MEHLETNFFLGMHLTLAGDGNGISWDKEKETMRTLSNCFLLFIFFFLLGLFGFYGEKHIPMHSMGNQNLEF